MVVITKIECLEVDQNPAIYKTYNGVDIPIMDYDNIPTDFNINVKEEYIHGREFIDVRGNSTIIGMTDDVSKQLGEPFNVIHNLQDTIHSLNNSIRRIRSDFDKERTMLEAERDMVHKRNNEISHKYTLLKLKYENMTFWERVKYVFGV